MDAQGDFLRRLVGVEIQAESADLVEAVAPEQALVDRWGLDLQDPSGSAIVFWGTREARFVKWIFEMLGFLRRGSRLQM